MLQFNSIRAVIGQVLASSVVALVLALVLVEPAQAAVITIAPQVERFDCSSVKPGDTLILPSGTRGPLLISNCKGSAANPIIIKNDSSGDGPTVIRRASGSSGGFIFNCSSCLGVVIDGSGKWKGAPSGKTYGIKVTMTGGGPPTSFVKIGGTSRFVTIRNVEVDGAWPTRAKSGSGIRVNENTIKRNSYPGLWREGIVIEDSYVHDVALEGMYVGPNYSEGELPLRDIAIRNNLVEDIGWEGINLKSTWAGDNRVHHNTVRRVGKNTSNTQKKHQYSGINISSGTIRIYNNWIETTGQHGIQVWTAEGPRISEGKGPFEAHIWNNVVVNAGELWRSFMAKCHGISVGGQSGLEKPLPRVYNNTIVDSRQSAIFITANTGPGFVRDNIIAGTGGNPVVAAPSFVELDNNRVGAGSQMEFVDPGRKNFRLKVASPARNEGTNGFPPIDFSGVARPKEGAADQGAFEGSGS